MKIMKIWENFEELKSKKKRENITKMKIVFFSKEMWKWNSLFFGKKWIYK